jgi:diaminopimelate epimerase
VPSASSAFYECLLLARDYERGTTIALCPGCGTGGCAVVALAVELGVVIAAIEVVAVDGAVR